MERSSKLYERVQNLISGTDEASDILFKSAYANYYDKQYKELQDINLKVFGK